MTTNFRRCRDWMIVPGLLFVIAAFRPDPILAGERISSIGTDDLTEVKKDNIGIHDREPEYFARAVDAGAKTVTIAGRDPFFVFWLPPAFGEEEPGRVLVALHGTNGNAYHHLMNFVDTAREYGVGVVSVQWGWERSPGQGYSYLDPESVYRIMSLALEYLDEKYPLSRGGHAWLGFSRSATQCVIYAHLDRMSGERHFCCFIAASGATSERQPEMKKLLAGDAGGDPVEGAHFYLWAGERDRSRIALEGDRVDAMRESKQLIEKLGGVVDIFRIGPEGHGGFNHNKEYQKEAYDLWKVQMPSNTPDSTSNRG